MQNRNQTNEQRTDDRETQRVLRRIFDTENFRKATKTWSTSDFERALGRVITETPKLFQERMCALLHEGKKERETEARQKAEIDAIVSQENFVSCYPGTASLPQRTLPALIARLLNPKWDDPTKWIICTATAGLGALLAHFFLT